MKQLTGNQVRALFLEFFKSKGHKVEPSHSLIPNEIQLYFGSIVGWQH